MARKYYYAVANGREIGVYDSWWVELDILINLLDLLLMRLGTLASLKFMGFLVQISGSLSLEWTQLPLFAVKPLPRLICLQTSFMTDAETLSSTPMAHVPPMGSEMLLLALGFTGDQTTSGKPWKVQTNEILTVQESV